MRTIEVSKPSGFICSDKTFVIYDEKSNVFYSRQNKRKATHFNLPKGVFTTDSENIKPAPFRKYKVAALPKRERNLPTPKNVSYKVVSTPNKCIVVRTSFDWVIMMDEKLASSRISREFAICHEFGHKYFGGFNPITQYDRYIGSEMKCDHYAVLRMLERGYNPSQLNNTEKLTLSNSDGAEKRKQYIYNILKNVK